MDVATRRATTAATAPPASATTSPASAIRHTERRSGTSTRDTGVPRVTVQPSYGVRRQAA
jgi:hypothetical protein